MKIYENIKIWVFACCMQFSNHFVNKVVLSSWSEKTQETTDDLVKDSIEYQMWVNGRRTKSKFLE